MSLRDDLLLERATDSCCFTMEWAEDAPSPSPIDWPIDKDLMVRAHRLLQRHAGRELAVRASLRKRIPVGAGMGGASSDAAAMLAALDSLFELKTDTGDLTRLASSLGSDVPFFLGAPSALVAGFGEAIEDLAAEQTIHLALILPSLQCNTAAVYRAYDELKPTAALDDAAVRRLARTRPLPPDGPFNDLAEAAFTVEPRLRELRDRCARSLGRPVHVTGSGAAMFVVAEDAASARALASEIRASGTAAIAVATL
ncbi:MAG: hypothetical protein HY899_07995 [Deltaproteobacteria bacterium]|nr:hypothetical protein [Deltaproteobacteria bacterium]